MNQAYKEAFEMLQATEEKYNKREQNFKAAFDSLNRAKNYLNQFSSFQLNFGEATSLMTRCEEALDQRDYAEAKEFGDKAYYTAMEVVGQSNPNIVIEINVDQFFSAGAQKKFDFEIRNDGKVEANDVSVYFGGSIEIMQEVSSIETLGPGQGRKLSSIGLFKNPGDNPFNVTVEAYNPIDETNISVHHDSLITVLDAKGNQIDPSGGGHSGVQGTVLIERSLTEDVIYDKLTIFVENKTNKIITKPKITLNYDDTQILAKDPTTGKLVKKKDYKLRDINPDEREDLVVMFDTYKSGIHKITGIMNYFMMVTVKGKEIKKAFVETIAPITIDRSEIFTDYQTYNDLAKKHLNSLIGIRSSLMEHNMLVEFQESVNMPKGVESEDVISYFNEAIESHSLIKRPVEDDEDKLDVYYFGMHLEHFIGLHFEVDKRKKVMEFDYFSSNGDAMAKLIDRVRKAFNRVLEERGAQTIVYAKNYVATAEAADALGKHQAAADIITETERIKAEERVKQEEVENKFILDAKKMQEERHLSKDRVKEAEARAREAEAKADTPPPPSLLNRGAILDESEMSRTSQMPEAPPPEPPKQEAKADTMSPAEAAEQYTKLLRDVWDDGVIIPVEQRILDRFRKAHNISDLVAEELEHEVKRELGLLDESDGGGA